MNKETRIKLIQFNKSSSTEPFLSEKYKIFEKYISMYVSGEGMIGENSYESTGYATRGF